jgi:3-hydroxyacyl-[acyl-carrier-protein] dehydratase
MVPPLIFDISTIPLTQVRFDTAAVEQMIPQRGQMRMLDGVIHLSEDFNEAVAFKDVRDDEFWVTGHIPGRPLLPGVLMIEAAAQLASLLTKHHLAPNEQGGFVGFVGADHVKFREQVLPGSRLLLLSKVTQFSRRRTVCLSQGLVNGTLVFEATVKGMLI